MMQTIRMRTETHVWQLTSSPTEAQPEAQRLPPVRMVPTTMPLTGNRDTLLVPVTTCAKEIFLDYAEAANEAWGPKGTGSFGFSAYDVIKAIRTRAGVGVDNGDPYLEACANSQDQMRELIRNERRLELCFENIRFYDLRRWNANLTEAAQGVNITRAANGRLTYTPIQVEERSYQPYMVYGPIPYNDVLNFGFIQNQGW